MLKVYIASSYSLGDVGINVRTSMECADQLMSLGYVPYSPLLVHFQHISFPRSYDDWLAYDIEWLKVCDVLLRLPGESKGADIEVDLATRNNIPVVYSIFELLNLFPVNNFPPQFEVKHLTPNQNIA